MTILTFVSQSSLVGLFLFVAINAATGRLSVFLSRLVTALAGNACMSAGPAEICPPMIEGLLVEQDDICPASLVLGVT